MAGTGSIAVRELLVPGEAMLEAVRVRLWSGTNEARQWFEDSAERWATLEYLRRRRTELFYMPPDLSRQERWSFFNDIWHGKSVAVFSEGRHDEHRPYVGVCFGIRPGWLGPCDLVVAHFGHTGCTSHISPLGVYDMFELPPEFHEPPGRYDDD